MIKEYVKVKTLVTKEDIPAGSIGIVVSIYSTGPACEVEIWDEKENPIDVVTYLFTEIKEIEANQ